MGMWRNIIQFIFPERCLLCDMRGDACCEKCKQQMSLLDQQQCFQCFRINKEGRLCVLCKEHCETLLDFLLVAASYRNGGTVARLIQKIKYKSFTRLIKEIPEDFFLCLKNIVLHDVVLVPVPLHSKRIAERGLNQSYLLCERIKSIYPKMVCWDGVQRIRYTQQQAKLSRTERLENVKDAFVLKTQDMQDPLDDSRVYLIVDDVSSTRATIEAVAQVLRRSGAKTVGAFVLARN